MKRLTRLALFRRTCVLLLAWAALMGASPAHAAAVKELRLDMGTATSPV